MEAVAIITTRCKRIDDEDVDAVADERRGFATERLQGVLGILVAGRDQFDDCNESIIAVADGDAVRLP